MESASPIVASRIAKTISGGQTENVDSTSQGSFKGLRYFMTACGNNRSRAMDVSVIDDNSSIGETVFAKTGGGISLNVSAKLVGSDIVLEVKNNEAFSIEVEVLKFFVGIN